MDGQLLSWVQTLTLSDYLGVLGVVFYIGSYFALQAGLIRGRGYLYPSLNAIAGALVLLSLVDNFNLPSVLINASYIAISVFGVARFYFLNRRSTFSKDEAEVAKELTPGLGPVDARRLLDLGRWQDAPSGYVLTWEGRVPEHIHFILDGAAQVRVSGSDVAALGSKSLVGEMSWLTGMEASATVTLSEPSRLFSLEISKLNALLGRSMEVRHELQSQFASHISAKLVRANAALSAAQAD